MKTKVIKFVVDNQDMMFKSFISFLEKRDGFLDQDELDKLIELEIKMNFIDEKLAGLNNNSAEAKQLFEKRIEIQRQYMLLMDPDWIKEAGLEIDEEGNVKLK